MKEERLRKNNDIIMAEELPMKKPKKRIKNVFEKVVENGGIGIGKAMIDEGYSPKTAKTPQKVTDSKSWEMLMDEYIPESLIAQTHKEAFEANRTISVVSGKQASGGTTDFVDVPDWQTRMKATELGYKIRGKLTDKSEIKISELKGLVGLETTNEKES